MASEQRKKVKANAKSSLQAITRLAGRQSDIAEADGFQEDLHRESTADNTEYAQFGKTHAEPIQSICTEN